jgi:hypothetical protein
MASLLSLPLLLISSLLFTSAFGGDQFRSGQSFQVSDNSPSRGNFFKAKLALRSDSPDDEDATDTLNTNAISYDNKPTFLNLKNLAKPANSLVGFGPVRTTTTTTTETPDSTTTLSPGIQEPEDDVIFVDNKSAPNSSPFIRQVQPPSFASRADPAAQFVQQQQQQQGIQTAPAVFGNVQQPRPNNPAPISIPISQNEGQLTFIPAGIPGTANFNQNQQGFVNPANFQLPRPRDDQPSANGNNFFEQAPQQNSQTQTDPSQSQFQQQQFNPQPQPDQSQLQQQLTPQLDQSQGQQQSGEQQFSQPQFPQMPQQFQQQQAPQFGFQGSDGQFGQAASQQQQQMAQAAPGTDGLLIPQAFQPNIQQADPKVALNNPFMQQGLNSNIFQQQPLPPQQGADQFSQFQRSTARRVRPVDSATTVSLSRVDTNSAH